jgi:hypothetical protein
VTWCKQRTYEVDAWFETSADEPFSKHGSFDTICPLALFLHQSHAPSRRRVFIWLR